MTMSAVSRCEVRNRSICCSSPLVQLFRHGSEEQIGRRVVRDIQQTVLDAAVAVLQAEVEHIALGSGKVPGRLTLRHLKTEPQRQPRFPYLWRSR